MAPANCDSRWTFELLPYTWQRRFQRFLLSLLLLVATSLLALDGASAATPLSPVPQSPPARSLTSPPLLRSPLPQPMIAASVLRIYIQGKLQYRTTQPIGTWLLTSINGSRSSYTLPNQPVDVLSGREISPGRGISLTCFLPNASTTTCSNITNARIIQAAMPIQTTNITLRVLVMVVSLNKSSECKSRGGADGHLKLGLISLLPNGPPIEVEVHIRNLHKAAPVYRCIMEVPPNLAPQAVPSFLAQAYSSAQNEWLKRDFQQPKWPTLGGRK
ncbi:hypothetical protein Vafri_16206 [Volvox africanus]|uniref:Uncharacterized protein n=1 Tax=Volvox africanus TaxID=51714 RepID=A0A8J4F8P3_9CHLO|nr:hypothetical protein Vafri_16206 [Volvox africanus]